MVADLIQQRDMHVSKQLWLQTRRRCVRTVGRAGQWLMFAFQQFSY
jgi:hypothetical protein